MSQGGISAHPRLSPRGGGISMQGGYSSWIFAVCTRRTKALENLREPRASRLNSTCGGIGNHISVDAGILDFGPGKWSAREHFLWRTYSSGLRISRETTSKGLVETREKVRFLGELVAGNAGNWRTKAQGFTASGKSTPEFEMRACVGKPTSKLD